MRGKNKMAGGNLDCETLDCSFFQQETSDCDSDSIASCSSESKIAKTSRKKLRISSSSVHVMNFSLLFGTSKQ